MHWNSLFTTQRLNETAPKSLQKDKLRTSFVKDYDRLIFSSAFRKLQNKTQVFPVPGVIFVHNRLTHSLEVASVGRSLGKLVGSKLVELYPNESEAFQDFYIYELGHVVSAACLAHDIGNPPFGHSGEDAIRNYFVNVKGDIKRVLHQELSKEELADLEFFEGNSNALRVLSNSFNELHSPYNLTLTTLASIIKYPTASHSGFQKHKGISYKKSGYFQREEQAFRTIMDAFELPKLDNQTYARHPFVYLTEAADDICYRIIDIEDAQRLGIVTIDEMMDMFMPFFDEETGFNARANVQTTIDNFQLDQHKAQYLRARWIGLMVDKVAHTFIEKRDALLAGTLAVALLDDIDPKYAQLINRINEFSVERIYNNKNVVEIELAGFNVIGALLEAFIEAIVYDKNLKSEKLLQLVEPQYVIDRKQQSLYQNILSIVDFISGMTDNYAIDLYRKIRGIDIAGFH